MIFTQGGHVTGLTTAAVVWTLAAIGCAIGFSYYGVAIALSVVVFMVLNVMEWIEDRVEHMRRGAHAHDERERKL
jgi:putative Mg2+ transporter-C (MgtC) family protein